MKTGNHFIDCEQVDKFHKCEDCQGSGEVIDTSYDNYGEKIECPRCNGKGYYEKHS
jgi:DnaJ-class molecular chaperone